MAGWLDFWSGLHSQVNALVWGGAMLTLMVGTGVYFTFSTRFFQVFQFRKIFRCTIGSLFSNKAEKDTTGRNLTPFQAVSTALAGTIGTGNIAGVATALVAGGAGAIFWMWVSAFFGMMTKYAEVVLAVHFREVHKDGSYSGGPMQYIEKGLGMPKLAALFAILCMAASFGIGNMAQSNSISGALQSAFGIPPLASGIFTAIVCGIVLLGGAERIGKVTERVVPFMAGFYLLGCMIFLFCNRMEIAGAFSLICKSAFTVQAAGGGIMGYTVKQAVHFGIARGVFTNEAGLGSAPIAHACSTNKNAVTQGMWGIAEVFIDTLLMCTITALVILTADGGALWSGGADGAALTTAAFSTLFGSFGSMFIAVAMIFFAVASILGWAFYGQKAAQYLSGDNGFVPMVYKLTYVALIALGATARLEVVWGISDTLNGLMAIPNLIAILLLSPVVIRLTREYRNK